MMLINYGFKTVRLLINRVSAIDRNVMKGFHGVWQSPKMMVASSHTHMCRAHCVHQKSLRYIFSHQFSHFGHTRYWKISIRKKGLTDDDDNEWYKKLKIIERKERVIEINWIYAMLLCFLCEQSILCCIVFDIQTFFYL